MAAATSVSNTAYGIIADAMLDVGYLQEGQRPDSEQLAGYMRRLKDIVNLCQTQGLKLFLQQELSFSMIANTSNYTFGPAGGSTIVMTKPARILQGYITANNVRRPLVSLSVDEWERLGQVVGNSGQVNSYMVRKFTNLLSVYLWPTPDATEVANSCTFLFQVAPAGPVLLSDDTSFPQEWRIYLRWALAADIGTGQPQTVIDRCEKYAAMYREVLEGWDVEDAPTYFAVDMRTQQGYGRFR